MSVTEVIDYRDGLEADALVDRDSAQFWRDRYEALEERFSWRPLRSAPRDGTFILIFIPFKAIPDKNRDGVKLKRPRVMSACWISDMTEKPGWKPSAFAIELYQKHGGFWSTKPKGKPLEGCPTHWMPRPDFPSLDQIVEVL